MKLFIYLVYILLVITPSLYFIENVFQITGVRYVKDFLTILLGLSSLLLLLKNNYLTKVYSTVIFIFSLIIIISLLNFEDITFYLISMREMIIYPFFYMSISLVLINNGVNINKVIYKGLIITLILMLVFLLFYSSRAFGVTNRFKAFFDGEHLSAIFCGLAFIYSLRYPKTLLIKVILIFSSFGLLLLTGTRSVLIISLLLYFGYNIKFSMKSIATITIVGMVFFYMLLTYFSRDFFYNIEERISEYKLALLLIEDNFLLGIGVDKYGVLGQLEKELIYEGMSTITMDSSIIKYCVNLGVPLMVGYFTFLFTRIFKIKTNSPDGILIQRVLLFSILMGFVTGKFGAYPINMIFFLNIVAFNIKK